MGWCFGRSRRLVTWPPSASWTCCRWPVPSKCKGFRRPFKGVAPAWVAIWVAEAGRSSEVSAEHKLGAFAAAAREAGFEASDFEFQEEVFDPQTAEVEARKGDLGVRRLRTEAVPVYPLGDGSDWVAGFAADLASGRFGDPPRR